MKVLVCLVAALCSFHLSTAIVCLPDACNNVDCSSAHAELMNCQGRIDPAGGMCGCCPACIKQLNEGENCEHNMLGTPSNSECGTGLQCHPGMKRCVKTETLVKGPCHAEVMEASRFISSGMVGVHLPECLEDGSYAPVQCREAVCTCVDKRGKQLYGIQASVGRHNEMNCQCARDKDARKTSMIVFERQCDEIGNYERVQCTRGTCFCVNAHGQKIQSFGERPEERKHELGGCLERHRREAVEQGACARELELIASSGSPRPGQHKPQCLEDGSYAPVQCREAVCSCVDSAGRPTGHSANVGFYNQMSCSCARDQADYRNTGMVGKTFSCDNFGNYNPIQCVGSFCHCVDNTGAKLEAIAAVPIHMISTLRCDQPKPQALGACARELELLAQGPTLMGAHKPQCLEDGSYHPRQCRESVCTCVDSEGLPTEVSAHVSQASKMTCACARDAADYFKTGLIGNMFFCDELGNYKTRSDRRAAVEQGACARELELLSQGPTMLGARKPTCLEDGSYHPRQCHGSVCTCVDSEGMATETSAHISQASQMTCQCARDANDYYKTGLIGKMFFCDELGNYKTDAVNMEEMGACARELYLLSQGPTMLGARKPTCKDDGSYHPRQCFGSVCTCVDSEGKSTGVSAPISQAHGMHCECARTKADYKKTGKIGLMHQCDELGNFSPIQCIGSVCHCVDKKGNQLESSPSVSIAEIATLRC